MNNFCEKTEERLKLFYDNRVVNWHEHVWEYPEGEYNAPDTEGLIKAGEKYGFDILVCSTPDTSGEYCPIETVVRKNNVLFEAMKKYPEIRGMCFVNPGLGKEAIDEIDRCVNELGMIGIKMYHHYFIDDEVQYPIVEKCIELDIPILVHAGKLTYMPESQPRISSGEHFANIARRYPEAQFIMAHITGGGDWDWQLKGIKNYENIAVDISGSIIDSAVIEKTVAAIGADRVLFGTDGSVCSGVGKMLDCNISEDEKKIILSGRSFLRYIDRD